MLKKILLAWIIFSSSSLFAFQITDDTNQQLEFKKPATCIVSLSPDITEILFAIGAGKNIVGVMQGSDYPKAALQLPVVANYATLNQEAILLLHPDLIVAWNIGNVDAELQFFQKFHIPIYLVQPTQISDVAKTMRNLGKIVGKEKFANVLANQYMQQYNFLQNKFSHQKKVKVFYEVWPKPLMTVNKTSWINQAITLCGGENIFANARGASPVINIEAVLLANPDFIIADPNEWRAWPMLKAAKLRHIKKIPPDLLERASPRLIQGVSALCELLNVRV